MNVGSVVVQLGLQSAQFMQGMKAALAPLKALQEQAQGLASSFRFIGGALATGGIVGLVTNLAEAEDSFLAMKAAMSGAIAQGTELNKNYTGLQKVVRGLATDTGFSAKEIADTATEFLRANISVRQTAESLESVINLAKAEGDDLSDIAQIAIDISKAFGLTGDQFKHTADVLANASLASNVTIRDLGTSFKYVAGVANEFDQSIESTAGLLAVLADEGQRGSLAGTALRQIFISLQKDSSKATGMLQRFGVSLFQGGEMAQRFDSKFRPLPDILLELGKKAGTAGNFINIFQARALTAALGIADESAEAFAKLSVQVGQSGTAAALAATRSESLVTQFNRLKATVNEFVISLGFQGGLIGQLKAAVDGLRSFFQALANLNPRILQFITSLIVSAAKVAVAIAGFVALAGAAAAVLSPIGKVAIALFSLGEAAKEQSIFEAYAKELDQLGNLFSEFAGLVGNKIGSVITTAIGKVFYTLGKAFKDQVAGMDVVAGAVYGAIANGLYTISAAASQASIGFIAAADANSEALEKTMGMISATGALKVSMDSLQDSEHAVAQATDIFSVQIGEANAVLNEIRGEITKLSGETAPASQKIRDLMASIAAAPGAQGTVLLLEEMLHKAMDLEAQLSLAGGKNPGELLEAGMKIAEDQIKKTQEAFGGFDAETAGMVAELERLKTASEAIGAANVQTFDELIAKVKEARAEQKGLFTVEFGRGISNGINEMVSGFLRGTKQTISAGELLRGALISEFESMFQQIIAKKLIFDKVFKDNFNGLGKFVSDTFGNLFSGAGTAAASVGKSILGSLGIPSFADGALVSGGMLAMVGDAGPSGRGAEAILPLDKLKDFGGGANVMLNVYTDQSSDRVNVKETAQPGGDRLIEASIGAVERNILSRGSIHRAMLATSTTRSRTLR